jgi:hypothetical protein
MGPFDFQFPSIKEMENQWGNSFDSGRKAGAGSMVEVRNSEVSMAIA